MYLQKGRVFIPVHHLVLWFSFFPVCKRHERGVHGPISISISMSSLEHYYCDTVFIYKELKRVELSRIE